MQSLTPPPPYPTTEDSSTEFEAKAAAHVAWYSDTHVPQLTQFGEDVQDVGETVAGLANFKGAWSDLSDGLVVPASVYHEGYYWVLLSTIDDVTEEEPGLSAVWIQPPGQMLLIDDEDVSASKTWSSSKIDAEIDSLTDDIASLGNAKAEVTGDVYSGLHNFTGATLTVATKPTGTNDTSGASTAFVQGEIKAQDISIGVVVPTPTTATSEYFFRAPVALTLTRVDAGVKGSTSATFQLYEVSTFGQTGAAIMSSNLVADSNGASKTSFGNAGIAAGAWLRLAVSSISGAPEGLSVAITGRRA